MSKQQKQAGFSAIELLITLFVAVGFLVAGYQLYFLVIKDSGQARAQSRATNAGYGYLRQYSSTTANPCVASTPVNNSAVTISNLGTANLTVTISCPFASSGGTNDATSVSKVDVLLTYGSNPQQSVRLATYVRDANNADVTSGLVGWWKLNNDATDSSGNGLNGTVTGATVTSGQNGIAKDAYNFVAANSPYIQLGSSATLGALTNNFTVSAWVNMTTGGVLQPIITAARTVTTGNGFALHLNTSNAVRFSTYGVKDYDSVTAIVPVGSWTFITAVLSSNNATFYINGNQKDTITHTTGGLANSDDGYHIGARTGPSTATLTGFFDGSIDDVRVYNRVLSATEITQMYNAGAQ